MTRPLVLCWLLVGCAQESSMIPPTAYEPALVVQSRDRPDQPMTTIASPVRWGAPLVPRVEGAKPGASIVLRMRTGGQTAWARYVADADGSCDVATATAEDGTYRGVEPDGL